jgi:rare lipoprotein A
MLLGPALGLLLLAGCGTTDRAHASRGREMWQIRGIQHGKASYYSTRCNGGTRTASGERLSNEALTAAHKTLPMGTKVRVTNLSNGKSEVVRINDRGPYIRGRVIDVTIGVAQRLGFVSRGIAPVRLEVLEAAGPRQAS